MVMTDLLRLSGLPYRLFYTSTTPHGNSRIYYIRVTPLTVLAAARCTLKSSKSPVHWTAHDQSDNFLTLTSFTSRAGRSCLLSPYLLTDTLAPVSLHQQFRSYRVKSLSSV